MKISQIKRINKELLELQRNPYCNAWPADESNKLHLTASIIGPNDSPFKGGIFFLKVYLPTDYPFTAPTVLFVTRIYHPCVSFNGTICLDELWEQWSPASTISKILLSIRSLIINFNEYHLMEPKIAAEYKNNKSKYEETAREWTRRYAT